MKNKKFCQTHSFNYSGPKCPFCEQERIDKMLKMCTPTIIKIKTEDKNVVTQESLDNLLAKFNNR